LRKLKTRPDCLFVIDPAREKNAVKEANTSGIPVIALIDSNADPSLVTLPIPANDDAVTSIKLIVEAVAEGYRAGKQSA
jgi:small subunit ribosomal protein S2